MGTLRITRFGHRLLVAAALLGGAFALTSCPQGCREEIIGLELTEPYTAYFNQLTYPSGSFNDGRVVLARSSTGLTDSYLNVEATTGGMMAQPEARQCAYYFSTGRTVLYSPSLYRHHFRLSVAQYPDGPVLIVEEPDTDESALYYSLTEERPEQVRYYSLINYGFQRYDVLPEAETLPTLLVDGHTYTNVLRLTNPYAAEHGSPNSATVYYIDRGYGLLRFQQRDGTIWNLTP